MIQNAHKFIDQLMSLLFASENRRLTSWIDKLCEQNQEARGDKPVGFLFNGVFYRPSNIRGHIPVKRSLHLSLAPQMESYLKDKALLDEDKAFISQTVFALLGPCTSDQDIRDTLPECLIQVLSAGGSSIGRLERTRPAGFTLTGNERAWRQYQKVLPKMEEYTATRLIF